MWLVATTMKSIDLETEGKVQNRRQVIQGILRILVPNSVQYIVGFKKMLFLPKKILRLKKRRAISE
jgi:hypothetical protein